MAQSSPVPDLEIPLLVPGASLQAPWQATCRPSRLGAEARLLQSRQKPSKSSSVKHQLSLVLLLPIAQVVAALLTGALRHTEVLPFQRRLSVGAAPVGLLSLPEDVLVSLFALLLSVRIDVLLQFVCPRHGHNHKRTDERSCTLYTIWIMRTLSHCSKSAKICAVW